MTEPLVVCSSQEQFDAGTYDLAELGESLLYKVLCVRKGVDPQRAFDHTFPAGTTGGWQAIAAREDLPDGWWEGDGAREAARRFADSDDPRDAPYPQPCGNFPDTHHHVVGTC